MRGIVRAGWIAAAAAACGPSESAFVVDYTDAYCGYYLECGDSAQLVFDGISTIEDCRAFYGPAVAEQGSLCKVARGPAKRCLDALETLPCPEEAGTFIDDVLPVVCEEAWKKCLGQPQESGE